MSEWQPIETAPRDSGPLLFFLKDSHLGSRIHCGTFIGQDKKTMLIGGYFSYDVPTPTHWQPLPDPPTDLGDVV